MKQLNLWSFFYYCLQCLCGCSDPTHELLEADFKGELWGLNQVTFKICEGFFLETDPLKFGNYINRGWSVMEKSSSSVWEKTLKYLISRVQKFMSEVGKLGCLSSLGFGRGCWLGLFLNSGHKCVVDVLYTCICVYVCVYLCTCINVVIYKIWLVKISS